MRSHGIVAGKLLLSIIRMTSSELFARDALLFSSATIPPCSDKEKTAVRNSLGWHSGIGVSWHWGQTLFFVVCVIWDHVISEDRLARIPTRHHVIDRAGVLYSKWLGHGTYSILATPSCKQRTRSDPRFPLSVGRSATTQLLTPRSPWCRVIACCQGGDHIRRTLDP